MSTVPTGPGNNIDRTEVKFNAHINLGLQDVGNSTLTAEQIQAAIELGFNTSTPPIVFSSVNVQGPINTPILTRE